MEMKPEHIGVLVVGGFVLFAAGTFLIGDRRQMFSHHSEFYAEFVNLAGLSNGAKVRVAGMDAGQVKEIRVPDSPSSRFRVKLRIDSKLRGLVRSDSVATIGTEGMVGGTYLSVRAGTAQAPPAALLATIPSTEPTDLSEMLAGGAHLLHDAQLSLNQISAKLGTALDTVTTTVSNANDVVVDVKSGRGTVGMLMTDDRLAKELRRSVTATASDVRDLVGDVKQGRGVAGMLLRDEEVAGRVRETVSSVQRAAADLDHAAGQADALVSDLNTRRISEKAGIIADQLEQTTRQARALMSDVSKPDRLGVSAGANIRESLTNANVATANLADASEALKHNFLTRGFFKERGYYTLAEIPPEQYRREGGLNGRSTDRLWLPAGELFQTAGTGEEELSASGKALLLKALVEHAGSIAEQPVIIEGYSGGEARASQQRVSRARAMLVRQYVQQQFQLEAKNLGVVPLNAAPPNGTGRATWDGVCIVLLEAE
jgi:phospholipid/cholesterol/gamma-HCH transport system substrate-binding protein